LSTELEEKEQLDHVKEHFEKYINFKVYTQFFRTFCVNKFTEEDYMLRANFNSFSKGITYWYGGRQNPTLARLLFTSLTKKTSKLSLSQFIYFLREL